MSIFSGNPILHRVKVNEIKNIPQGLKSNGLSEGETDVLKWGAYTIVSFSYHDNRMATELVLYDEDWSLVQSWTYEGVRYIESIELDAYKEMIKFTGQSDLSFDVSYKSLTQFTPKVNLVESNTVRDIPSGMKLTSIKDGTTEIGKAPTMTIGDFTYYAFSFDDNRMSTALCAYDQEGKLVNQFAVMGPRYAYEMNANNDTQEVTIMGQAGHQTVVSYEDLVKNL